MCAQIKERKVKEKYSKERGWRAQEIDTDIDRERAGRESVAGEEEVVGRYVPPERETFGVEEDKLKSKTGVRTRARRGKQNGEREAERKRQRSGANDRQWEQQRKNRRKRLGKKSTSCPLLTYCSPLS